MLRQWRRPARAQQPVGRHPRLTGTSDGERQDR
jgi:hypothetical protein